MQSSILQENNMIFRCIIILSVMISLSGAVELPTVKATGGEGTAIDWPRIKSVADSMDPEDAGAGFFYDDCAQGVGPDTASSTLAPQGGKNYRLANICDENPMTAWIEGKPGYGIGEYFQIITPVVNTIYNGYQSTPSNWKNNSRVKTFKVYRNGRPLCYLELIDEMGRQWFDLPFDDSVSEDSVSYDKTVFRFEIVDVYKGLKYKDVAISEINYVGCCFPGATVISGMHGTTTVSALAVQDTILGIDVESGGVSATVVTKISRQVHHNLLKVTCGSRSIEITPDHPLYVKGYGFLSVDALMKKRNVKRYDELVTTVEIGVWDDSLEVRKYVRLTSIEPVTGQFDTYSVRGLKNGSAYSANGFITTPY